MRERNARGNFRPCHGNLHTMRRKLDEFGFVLNAASKAEGNYYWSDGRKGGLVWFGLGVFDDIDTIWKVQDDDGF
jgi:hypothetical protein